MWFTYRSWLWSRSCAAERRNTQAPGRGRCASSSTTTQTTEHPRSCDPESSTPSVMWPWKQRTLDHVTIEPSIMWPWKHIHQNPDTEDTVNHRHCTLLIINLVTSLSCFRVHRSRDTWHSITVMHCFWWCTRTHLTHACYGHQQHTEQEAIVLKMYIFNHIKLK